MAEKNYDPVLRQAMADVKKVLRKHDVSGTIFLGSREGMGEFHIHIEPEWNLLKFEKIEGSDKHAIRFKAKGQAEGYLDKKVQATTNFIFNLTHFLGLQFQGWSMLGEQIQRQSIITHNEGYGKIRNDDREIEDTI